MRSDTNNAHKPGWGEKKNLCGEMNATVFMVLQSVFNP